MTKAEELEKRGFYVADVELKCVSRNSHSAGVRSKRSSASCRIVERFFSGCVSRYSAIHTRAFFNLADFDCTGELPLIFSTFYSGWLIVSQAAIRLYLKDDEPTTGITGRF